jgi:protein TonB
VRYSFAEIMNSGRFSLSCRSHRLLTGALLLSLLLHLLLVFGWGWAPLWVRALPTSGAPLAMQVVVSARPAAPSDSSVPVPAAARPQASKPLAETRVPPVPVLAVEKASNALAPAVVLAPVATQAQESPAVSLAAAPDSTRGAPAAAGDGVSADGLRQYRIDLAGAARRFRHYPAVARSRGWEGVAEVVVSVNVGVPVPLVKLHRTSGHALLDEQAVEMLTRAVAATPLPESLRGRSFSVPMPIRFSLEE